MASPANRHPSTIELRCFPSDDPEFRRFAREALACLADADPAALQCAIRRRYPLAVVSVQAELASMGSGPEVWYAFRRAVAEPPPIPWWENEAAHAVIGLDRAFVEATDAFAAIVEVPPQALVGARLEDLANPADLGVSEDIAALFEELLQRGIADGTLRFNRTDGTPRELEYHVERAEAEAGRFRVVIRERAL